MGFISQTISRFKGKDPDKRANFSTPRYILTSEPSGSSKNDISIKGQTNTYNIYCKYLFINIHSFIDLCINKGYPKDLWPIDENRVFTQKCLYTCMLFITIVGLEEVSQKHMPVDATAIIGLLVGFLVVGVIGIYVGDQMVQAANLSSNNTLYSSQQSIIATFQLGVTLCKIIVIVSIASIVFVLLQKTGLIPRFGEQ